MLTKPAKGAAAKAKRARRRKLLTDDAAESDKVRLRSGERCEMRVTGVRCLRRASQVHHLLNGIGMRARGSSKLAENKLYLCMECHQAIHAHRLVPDGPDWQVR